MHMDEQRLVHEVAVTIQSMVLSSTVQSRVQLDAYGREKVSEGSGNDHPQVVDGYCCVTSAPETGDAVVATRIML
eukprot:6213426-Pleurochrysis_carterae.AAC.2